MGLNSATVAWLSAGMAGSGGPVATLPPAGHVWNGSSPYGVEGELVTPTRTDAPENKVVRPTVYGDPDSPLHGLLTEYPAYEGFSDQATPAQILRALLVFENVFGDIAADWPIYVTTLPDKPDNAAVVTDTTALKDGRLLGSGKNVFHYGIQLMVRGTVHKDTYDRVASAALFLENVSRVPVVVDENTYGIVSVTQTSSVLPLGTEPEGKRRFMFSVNFIMALADADDDS